MAETKKGNKKGIGIAVAVGAAVITATVLLTRRAEAAPLPRERIIIIWQ